MPQNGRALQIRFLFVSRRVRRTEFRRSQSIFVGSVPKQNGSRALFISVEVMWVRYTSDEIVEKIHKTKRKCPPHRSCGLHRKHSSSWVEDNRESNRRRTLYRAHGRPTFTVYLVSFGRFEALFGIVVGPAIFRLLSFAWNDHIGLARWVHFGHMAHTKPLRSGRKKKQVGRRCREVCFKNRSTLTSIHNLAQEITQKPEKSKGTTAMSQLNCDSGWYDFGAGIFVSDRICVFFSPFSRIIIFCYCCCLVANLFSSRYSAV